VAHLFDDSSLIRTVHREWVVSLYGPRALLMQAAHPVAFEGFYAHTGALDEPYERLERTAKVMDEIIFGSRAKAERMTRRVRGLHRRYGADRPDLLLWVLATLVDSGLAVYERYVRSLSRDEREAYWQDWRVVGGLFGLAGDEMPADVEAFDAYMDAMLRGDVLHVGDEARELSLEIVLRPPVPLAARPLLELANGITVGLLPPRIRTMYGLGWDPARGLALRAGAEYTKRVLLPLLPSRLRLRPA
jgi:uncharacterized protein (DUF2236 family)